MPFRFAGLSKLRQRLVPCPFFIEHLLQQRNRVIRAKAAWPGNHTVLHGLGLLWALLLSPCPSTTIEFITSRLYGSNKAGHVLFRALKDMVGRTAGTRGNRSVLVRTTGPNRAYRLCASLARGRCQGACRALARVRAWMIKVDCRQQPQRFSEHVDETAVRAARRNDLFHS